MFPSLPSSPTPSLNTGTTPSLSPEGTHCQTECPLSGGEGGVSLSLKAAYRLASRCLANAKVCLACSCSRGITSPQGEPSKA